MERILLGMSLSCNAIAVIVGFRLVQQRGGWDYIQQFWARRWHLSLQETFFPYYHHRRDQLSGLPIGPEDIVFLGDSLTDEGEWGEWFHGLSVKNRGVSAETTTGLLQRLEPIVAGQPRQILLLIGCNDLLGWNHPIPEVMQRYCQILQQIQQQSPHTQVYVQSLFPMNPALCGRDRTADLVACNRHLAQLAAEFGYPYLNLFDVFANSDQQLDPQYTCDGLHLNGAGYQRWSQVVQPYLNPS